MSLPRNRRAERAVIRMLERGMDPEKLKQALDHLKKRLDAEARETKEKTKS